MTQMAADVWKEMICPGRTALFLNGGASLAVGWWAGSLWNLVR